MDTYMLTDLKWDFWWLATGLNGCVGCTRNFIAWREAKEGDKDDGDTATRETKEEMGLDPSLMEVVTVVQPFL